MFLDPNEFEMLRYLEGERPETGDSERPEPAELSRDEPAGSGWFVRIMDYFLRSPKS